MKENQNFDTEINGNTALQREKPDYQQEILHILRSKNSPKVIRDELEDYHENDIASVLPKLDLKERESLYRLLSVERLSDILEFADDGETYINELDLKKAAQIIENMESDVAVELLRQVEPQKRKLLIELLDEETQQSIRMLASYDEDQIGSRMTTNFVTISSRISIKEAMRSVVDQAAEHDNISVIYVLDEHEVYYGAISLKDLIIAREGTSIDDIVVTAYPYLYADEEIDDCLDTLKDYCEDSIPVLSEDNRILGVITSQDMIEVIDDDMGEDYAKLAGLSSEEDLQEPIKASIRKRLPWLMLLLGLGLVVSSVVGIFEGVVEQLTLIVCFQSLVLDMAGNVGTQSLAVTIRVLMDEKLTGKMKAFLVWKEMKIGFSNGFLLGVLAFLGVGGYIFLFKGMGAGSAFAVSGCIGISMLIAMVISSLVGTVVPIAFKKIGVDPAVASGPLITTINDLVAVVTYYGLAWLLLLQVLHMAG